MNGESRGLPVVDHYKHLGSWTQAGSSHRLDVVRKASQVRAAARPLRMHVLSNSSLSVRHRVLLAGSLVFSRGLFAASAWPRLAGAEMKRIHAAMMTVYRTIAAEERWRHSKLNDLEVLKKILAPAPAVTLRIKRLRLFTSLVVRRVWHVLVIVATGSETRNSWLSTVVCDLAWAAQRTVALESMIGASLAAWIQRIDSQPKTIFTLLKIACEAPDCELLRKLVADRGFNEADDQVVFCPECLAPFHAAKDLAVHRANAHKVNRIAAAYAPLVPLCPICLLLFGSRGQVIEHLGRAPTCMLNVVFFSTPLEPAQRLAADAAVREASKAARALGFRSTHSGLPYVQAYGPVRPIVLPFNAPAYSPHIPLRLALRNAVRVDYNSAGLGGVSSIDPETVRQSVLLALSVQEQRVLCI